MRENFFVGRRLFGFSLHFALELAEHDEFVRIGLLATAIDLQIAQDQCALAVSFQKNKWIRRPKFRRVKHVGISLAGGDDQAVPVLFLICSFPLVTPVGVAGQPDRLLNHQMSRRNARPTHEICFFSLRVALRKIQCNSPSNPSVDTNQNRRIEEKHIKLYSEITFLRAEEHVRLVPAAIVALVHLRV